MSYISSDMSVDNDSYKYIGNKNDIIKLLCNHEGTFYYEDFTGVPNLFLFSDYSPINKINSTIFRKSFNDYHSIFTLEDKNTSCDSNFEETPYCYCCGNLVEASDWNCDHLIPVTTMFCTVIPQSYFYNLFYIHDECNKKKRDISLLKFYEQVGSGEIYVKSKMKLGQSQITNVPDILFDIKYDNIKNILIFDKQTKTIKITNTNLLTGVFEHLKERLKVSLQKIIREKISKLDFLSPKNSVQIFNYLCDTQEIIGKSYETFANNIKNILWNDNYNPYNVKKRKNQNKNFINLDFEQLFWLYLPVQDFKTYEKYNKIKWKVEKKENCNWKIIQQELNFFLLQNKKDIDNDEKRIRIRQEISNIYSDYNKEILVCNQQILLGQTFTQLAHQYQYQHQKNQLQQFSTHEKLKQHKNQQNVLIEILEKKKKEISERIPIKKKLYELNKTLFQLTDKDKIQILKLQIQYFEQIYKNENKHNEYNSLSELYINSILNLNLNLSKKTPIYTTVDAMKHRALDLIIREYYTMTKLTTNNDIANEKKVVKKMLLLLVSNNELMNNELKEEVGKIYKYTTNIKITKKITEINKIIFSKIFSYIVDNQYKLKKIKDLIRIKFWYIFFNENNELLFNDEIDIKDILRLNEQTLKNINNSIDKLNTKKCDIVRNGNTMKKSYIKLNDEYVQLTQNKKKELEKEKVVKIFLYLVNNVLVFENIKVFKDIKDEEIRMLGSKIQQLSNKNQIYKFTNKKNRLESQKIKLLDTQPRLILENIEKKIIIFSKNVELNLKYGEKELKNILSDFVKNKSQLIH